MNIANILAVAFGGALGSVMRYLVSIGAGKIFDTSFPWGTLIINISGSFIMGLLIEAFALKWNASEPVRVFLLIGFCGGFTTFSAFSADAVNLMARGGGMPAVAYMLCSVMLSIGGLYAGTHLLRALLP
jgi:CrcB protein